MAACGERHSGKEPGREIKVAHADGLEECRKLLLMAKAGKYDGYLLEGMACPGGCVAGAGTLRPIDKTRQAVQNFAAGAGIPLRGGYKIPQVSAPDRRGKNEK